MGIGYGQGWLSGTHVAYLGRGGIDGFIGDGAIRYKPERVVDVFYSYNLLSSTWLTADYQHIENPGYNADRGPVEVYGARVHVQFSGLAHRLPPWRRDSRRLSPVPMR